jgi:hypothetical protein
MVMVVAKAVDANWEDYFSMIQKVCPWSWAAWKQGQIDITKWQGEIIDLGPLEARVYVTKGLNPRRLKKLSRDLDQGTYEWLWSYPGYGRFAAPRFCLIQQDRARLSELRKNNRERTQNIH